jgi:hypothetical protein
VERLRKADRHIKQLLDVLDVRRVQLPNLLVDGVPRFYLPARARQRPGVLCDRTDLTSKKSSPSTATRST